MRRIALIGVVIAFLVGTGLTIVWMGQSDGKLVVQTPSAIAQSDTSAASNNEDEQPPAQTTNVNQSITDSGQSAIKSAIAAVGPAVVRIDVTGTVEASASISDMFNDPFFRRFFGTPDAAPQERTTQSLGSGFAILYHGETLVITNQHVIADADTIEVSDNGGNSWNAVVVGSDDVLDVAVLRLEGDTRELPTATLGDSDAVELGDWAIAIGSPLGLSYTVTLGIISAKDRDIEKPSGVGNFTNLIQTDAAINPGNSGGPLVNALGQVIGINTMIARNSATGVSIEGINFAVAINGVTEVLDQLVQSGEVQRGWLGVQHTEINKDSAAAYGIDPNQPGTLVISVFPGDPADSAGIQAGDVITHVGETAIEESDDLNRTVGLLSAGTTIDFTVIRDGQSLTLPVTLGLRPSEETLLTYQGQTPASNANSFRGITVGPISAIIAQQLGLNSTDGVVIMDIATGSKAEEAGLSEGDVILEIGSEPIVSVDAWDTAISQLDASDGVTFTVYRNGSLRFVTVE
ncbi:PDZ domain-containing protein [Candidatus Bipolaricaulota bacterium]|nr:PDZ domain-containing protein [Candidatus Bipolaricaulota bacterium]